MSSELLTLLDTVTAEEGGITTELLRRSLEFLDRSVQEANATAWNKRKCRSIGRQLQIMRRSFEKLQRLAQKQNDHECQRKFAAAVKRVADASNLINEYGRSNLTGEAVKEKFEFMGRMLNGAVVDLEVALEAAVTPASIVEDTTTEELAQLRLDMDEMGEEVLRRMETMMQHRDEAREAERASVQEALAQLEEKVRQVQAQGKLDVRTEVQQTVQQGMQNLSERMSVREEVALLQQEAELELQVKDLDDTIKRVKELLQEKGVLEHKVQVESGIIQSQQQLKSTHETARARFAAIPAAAMKPRVADCDRKIQQCDADIAQCEQNIAQYRIQLESVMKTLAAEMEDCSTTAVDQFVVELEKAKGELEREIIRVRLKRNVSKAERKGALQTTVVAPLQQVVQAGVDPSEMLMLRQLLNQARGDIGEVFEELRSIRNRLPDNDDDD